MLSIGTGRSRCKVVCRMGGLMRFCFRSDLFPQLLPCGTVKTEHRELQHLQWCTTTSTSAPTSTGSRLPALAFGLLVRYWRCGRLTRGLRAFSRRGNSGNNVDFVFPNYRRPRSLTGNPDLPFDILSAAPLRGRSSIVRNAIAVVTAPVTPVIGKRSMSTSQDQYQGRQRTVSHACLHDLLLKSICWTHDSVLRLFVVTKDVFLPEKRQCPPAVMVHGKM